jgi:hypothetical protein
MKTMREYYKQCFQAERPTFVKVMKAVPPDRSDYKPHPRSTSAADLVWLLASELHDACELIDRGEVNYVYRPASGGPSRLRRMKRTRLSSYLRPMGAKVPPIYGPSADDPGGM